MSRPRHCYMPAMQLSTGEVSCGHLTDHRYCSLGPDHPIHFNCHDHESEMTAAEAGPDE